MPAKKKAATRKPAAKKPAARKLVAKAKRPAAKAKAPAAGVKASASEINAIIKKAEGWKGKKLTELRAIISKADPALLEEVKWKMPSKPEGVIVWSHNGIVCHADVLKTSVRINFHKGKQLKDPKKLFNARLDSSSVRAIDFPEDGSIDKAALTALVQGGMRLNSVKTSK
ncbi:MAG: DUF1801 domain-containing protein [Anaerolineales bacterium]|nr:DUF1801 domain-containing protein [Anaerolineales bacterium]